MMMETALNRKIEETLAKLSASVATPTRSWSFLPSVTKAPLVPEALPSLRLKPPRFDGENVRDWINKIQTYYNHHYTPLDDRLYLTQYLFDSPASDWMEYWVENNKGRGWNDFLLALKQRFDPDLYDYVGRLATLRQISTIEVYQTSFESLLQKASHIGDSTLSSLFIAGLKSPMKQVVLMRRPSTLQETFAIVQKLDQRKPNRTNIQEAIDDGEGIPNAPSPAAPSTATTARANQPMDGVGKMILTVDEEILDADDERKLGGNSSGDGDHSDSVALAVSAPHKVVTSESLLLEVTTVWCIIEPAPFDAIVETHKPRAETINAEKFVGEMDDCFSDIKVVTEIFKCQQQLVTNIEQLQPEVWSLDVVGEDKDTYFGEVKVLSSEVHGGECEGDIDDKMIVSEMMNNKVKMFSTAEFFIVTESVRRDYSWVIIGSAGFGASCHIGPHSISARILRDSKNWRLLAPDVMQHKIRPSSNRVVVVWPFSILKWFMHFCSATRNWERTGVVVLVPNDWWHLVTHLEDYVTITKYFASTENWLHVFYFLIWLNPGRGIYGTRDGILWYVHWTYDINLALHGTIDELKMDSHEKESDNSLFLGTLTNYTAAPEVHKLRELVMSCDYMQVKKDTEDCSLRDLAKLGSDYGMLELSGPVAPHVVDVLRSYFEFHLEGKVVFNGGRVDMVLDLVNLAENHLQYLYLI